MSYTYTFSVANDTRYGKVDRDKLEDELTADHVITETLETVSVTGDDLDVTYANQLPSTPVDHEQHLSNIVTMHDGKPAVPLPEPVRIYTGPNTPAPAEPDGKEVVVVSPSTEGWMTWFTGAGDNLNPTPPATGRGQGNAINVTLTEPGTETLDLNFLEPVELHDGEVWYSPVDQWTNDDTFSFSAYMPATVTTPNAGLGNVNLVNLGGYNLIVPSSTNNGSHDVDLEQAVPVPAQDPGDGYWDADAETNAITANTGTGGNWMLFDVPIESFFLKRIPMGNPLGKFEIDAYKAEWISSRWTLRFIVERTTAGTGTFRVGGWLMLFRRSST